MAGRRPVAPMTGGELRYQMAARGIESADDISRAVAIAAGRRFTTRQVQDWLRGKASIPAQMPEWIEALDLAMRELEAKTRARVQATKWTGSRRDVAPAFSVYLKSADMPAGEVLPAGAHALAIGRGVGNRPAWLLTPADTAEFGQDAPRPDLPELPAPRWKKINK